MAKAKEKKTKKTKTAATRVKAPLPSIIWDPDETGFDQSRTQPRRPAPGDKSRYAAEFARLKAASLKIALANQGAPRPR